MEPAELLPYLESCTSAPFTHPNESQVNGSGEGKSVTPSQGDFAVNLRLRREGIAASRSISTLQTLPKDDGGCRLGDREPKRCSG